MQRQPRKKENGHLAFIRGLPCCVCGDNTSTEAAHVRYPCRRFAKPKVGMGEKPDDKWTVPLCGDCHLGPGGQHKSNEYYWWSMRGIDPLPLALALYAHSGDHEAGCQIIEAHHEALTP
jgi:hypothetical protein